MSFKFNRCARIQFKFALLGFTLLQAPYALSQSSAQVVALRELAQEIRSDHPNVPHLNLEEVQQRIGQFTVIDVRDPEEFQVSQIPGAINIHEPEALLKFANEHQGDLLLYCSVGLRSAQLTELLHSQGATHTTNFVGSIFAWGNQGLALTNAQGETGFVHPYNWYWGWRYLNSDRHPPDSSEADDLMGLERP